MSDQDPAPDATPPRETYTFADLEAWQRVNRIFGRHAEALAKLLDGVSLEDVADMMEVMRFPR